jgi:hypothetical protein
MGFIILSVSNGWRCSASELSLVGDGCALLMVAKAVSQYRWLGITCDYFFTTNNPEQISSLGETSVLVSCSKVAGAALSAQCRITQPRTSSLPPALSMEIRTMSAT